MKLLAWIGAVAGALAVWTACSGRSAAPQASTRRAEVPVVVAQVVRKDVPVELQVVGNVEALSTISVKSQIGGEITQVHFREGDFVKKGDLLYTIDPRPYQSSVSQAEANLARDRAALTQAEANLARDVAQQKYSAAQAGRYGRLVTEGVISKDQHEQVQSDSDAKSAAVRADQAAIESARANISADQAALETTGIQLGYTTIRSPIDGRTGNMAIKQGNVVKANDLEMVSINQINPIYVTFAVPEAQLPSVKRYMAQGKLSVAATPQNDPDSRETGTLTFVDNAVDQTTGTIKLKGTFTNADRKLWPGEFVRVILRLATQANAMVVPSQAVQSGQNGQYVFVVKRDMSVESRPVESGMRVGQEMVVEKGLSPGELVVTEGHLRLAPGVRVQIKTSRVLG